MSALVTIVVPTIGRPKYIGRTLDSILSQNYENLEILISDNYPSISSSVTLKGYLDPRIKIISQSRRLGFSEHMNVCLAASSGDYLMILSDDDIISSNYVSEMVGILQGDGVTVAVGTQEAIGENDFFIRDIENPDSRVISGDAYIYNMLSGKLDISVLTYFSLFARRKDIVKIGFKDYPDGSNADNFLFFSLALKGSVGVSGVWMGYRVYNASSGLSTPFSNLYTATWLYDQSIASMIYSRNRISVLRRLKLRAIFKWSSRSMLLARLSKIYKGNMPFAYYLFCRFKILFLFSISNIFFGFFKK